MDSLSGHGRRGLTLVEVLAALGIVALLAALLLPVFAGMAEKSHESTCQSNLKELALGFQAYAQDFDNHLPCGSTMALKGGPRAIGWGAQLNDYVKNPHIFHCPDDPTVAEPGYFSLSYAYNPDFAATSNGRNFLALSSLMEPGSTVELLEISGAEAKLTTPNETDSATANGWVNGIDGTAASATIRLYQTGPMGGSFAGIDPNSDGSYAGAYGRHNQSSNFLMVDGHVKCLRGTAVSPGTPASAPVTVENEDGPSAAGTAAIGADPAGPFVATMSPI